MKPYRSFSDAAEKPVWTPVVNPRPTYSGPDEARRYQEAVTNNPRGDSEHICEWLERVAAAARPVGDRELPRGDRSPASGSASER